MDKEINHWIFSNNPSRDSRGENADWNMGTILETKKYYFTAHEKNRSQVKKGDVIIFREYGSGFWGDCIIADDWVFDSEGENKYKTKTGWFPIGCINKWKAILPFEVIYNELSYKNHRMRIAKITQEDKSKVDLAVTLYLKLGYGSMDGVFFILENGVEEAVKKNLSQLKLKLAEYKIHEQCVLGLGIGRTDLICRDEKDNFVVLELKIGKSSDNVVGQILKYMGYIKENWATKEQKDVRGIILTPGYDEKLLWAVKGAGEKIKILRLRIK